MLKNDQIYLIVAGVKFSGWKTAEVVKNIEDCSGSFSFSLVAMNELEKASLVSNAPCQVSIGNEQIINGYIDKVAPSGDDSGLQYIIKGRDKTGDIVDCSAECAPYEWKSTTLLSLANVLVNPFNIKVSKSGTFDDPKEKCNLEIGETPFEVLSKFAKARNIILTSDNNGDLIVGRPGTDYLYDSLVWGKNIKSLNGDFDGTNRFHKYIVKGQRSNQGGIWNQGSYNIYGEAFDEEIRECRVKIITADNMETNQTAKARAMWEALTRAAQSEKIDIITAGFRQSNGDLWKSNKLVHIIINTEAIEISTDMLVSSVTYTSSESGMITSLVLKRKEAYTEFVRATVKKKGKKQGIDWGKLINTK